MIKGDPIYSLTANNHGIMVRFSNRDSTDNFHEGLSKHLSWSDSTGQWVHVKIQTTFGKSMVVRAITGRFERREACSVAQGHGRRKRIVFKSSKRSRDYNKSSCNPFPPSDWWFASRP